ERKPGFHAAGIRARLPGAEDESEGPPKQEEADSPIRLHADRKDKSKALWPPVNNLQSDAELELHLNPDVPVDIQRQPASLVGKLSDGQGTRFGAEIDRPAQPGDVRQPGGDRAAREIGQANVYARHHANLVFIKVEFDGDEGNR